MAPNSTDATVGGRPRSRAKKACKACNSRRVRCNVMEQNPCANCKAADVLCELMKSRRGKYERHPQSRAVNTPKSPSIPAAGQPRQSEPEQSSPENKAYSRSNSASQENQELKDDNITSGTISSIFHVAPASASLNGSSIDGADSIVFLGESSSISLVHGPQASSTNIHPSPAEKTRLRYPIPDAVSIKTSTTPFETRRKAARIEYLTQDGAFTYPLDNVCEVLLGAYFEWFHPCFPIMDRHAFFNSYVTKTISPLLLQAMLFVGATHCNEKVMKDLGFPSRQDARNEMYNHVKDIYDADYEADKVTVCQALFLMSFWRAGPLLEKDTRHWLGAAISLAQSKGMHRSSSTTTFRDGNLRKRIWWSLYVRDRQCSVALGLPTRIRDEDCDIEMLEPSDFEEENNVIYPSFLGRQKREHVLFAVQMAKLTTYLGKIVLREYAPSSLPKKDSERSQLRDDLIKWESELSLEMKASSTADSLWASMLHLTYNNLYILLYRSAYLAENDEKSEGNVAMQAACRNTRITEDVLAQDLVQHLNVHITTSLFNSLCIHTICLRRSQNATRKLAEYRAQLCLLGLRELQKTWDVTNWVLQLFLQFLDQSTSKRLQLVADSEDAPAQQPGVGSASSPRLVDTSDLNVETRTNATGGPSGMIRGEEMNTTSLDFASHLFETKELQDFSTWQLQPDLFGGDVFAGGLDQYYNGIVPRGDDSLSDSGFR